MKLLSSTLGSPAFLAVAPRLKSNAGALALPTGLGFEAADPFCWPDGFEKSNAGALVPPNGLEMEAVGSFCWPGGFEKPNAGTSLLSNELG